MPSEQSVSLLFLYVRFFLIKYLKITLKSIQIMVSFMFFSYFHRLPVLIDDCAGRATEYVLGLASEQAELKDRSARVAKARVL